MKNWVKRSIRTFIQTAAGYLVVNLAAVDFTGDISTVKKLLIGVAVSATAAGIAAAMNLKETE